MWNLTIRTVVAAVALSLSASVHGAQEYMQYLNTFDQLAVHAGKPGQFFVRDAAGTRTGQNGDPTVKKGWAIYVWDTYQKKFQKIAEQESVDIVLADSLLTQYASIVWVNGKFDELAEYIAAIKSEILNKHQSDISSLSGSIGKLDTKVQSAEATVADVSTRVTTAEGTLTKAVNDIEILRQRMNNANLDNVEQLTADLTALKATVDDLLLRAVTLEGIIENVPLPRKVNKNGKTYMMDIVEGEGIRFVTLTPDE